MSTVIPFIPKHELDAMRNVRDFIDYCKNAIDLYGSDLDWDSPRWNVRHDHQDKGHYHDQSIVFSKFGSTRWNTLPLDEAYADFAKAYVRYQVAITKTNNFGNFLSAVRLLEAACIACGRQPQMQVYEFDEAAAAHAVAILNRHFSTDGSRYQAGWQLQGLLEFMVENKFLARPFVWRNPMPPPEMGTLLGEKHDQRRAAKLPSREVLAAVGTIFDAATEARDVLAVSCLALLCSAPARVSEVLTIQNNCEVWLPNDDGTKDLGFRWYPGKGGKKGIKHVLKLMEPVAVRALTQVRVLTEEGRKIAKWYEDNPDRLYLPPQLEYLRAQEFITGEELCLILGTANGAYSPKIAAHHGLTIHKTAVMQPNRMRKDGTRSVSKVLQNRYLFAELEQKIIGYLPVGFPWIDKENGVKFSEALFVTQKGIFNPTQGTMTCMFMPVSPAVILHQFGGSGNVATIFDRFGMRNPDGSAMKMTTHQARHWLNTIAERGGLTDLERDMWSGRVTSTKRNGEAQQTTRQSLAYLHNTTEELMIAAGLQPEDMDQGSFAAVVGKLPVSREEFLSLENKPTVHVTEFGVCFHDFSFQPCQVHADCLNCMEHACIKGDDVKKERIRDCHTIAVGQIEMARKLVEEKYLKAEPWYQHQALTEKRLNGLLKLLDDESLPPDSVIMLTNPFQYSAFRNAVEDRARNLGDALSVGLAQTLREQLALGNGDIEIGEIGEQHAALV